jgi:MscS family membrane protein
MRAIRYLLHMSMGRLLKTLTIIVFVSGFQMTAYADDAHPLKPIDTSSPRSTLKGFIEGSTEAYTIAFESIKEHLRNKKPFTDEDFKSIQKAMVVGKQTGRALDFSKIPPAMLVEAARKTFIQLKEILDRVDIPPDAEIPDAKMMASLELKRWTIPNTEITIGRIDSGERIGEYVFTAETIERVPEFYEKIKDLPYKTTTTENWYNDRSRLPTGIALLLRNLIPPNLILGENILTRVTILQQPLWRWIAIMILVALSYLLISLFNWLSGTSQNNNEPDTIPSLWRALLRPLGFVITTLLFSKIAIDVIHVSDSLYYFFNTASWTVFYLCITWLTWSFGETVAETIIISERINTTSIDGQVIRFVSRLVTIAAVISIIITGGEQIGLPTYSVVASLGVGGLAFALAAQQTLANLLGSLIIMFEKPFSIGDSVHVSNHSGVVEDVGFRSIRLKTKTGSLVTIPSSQIVNGAVENYGHNPPATEPDPDPHLNQNPSPQAIED